MRGDVHFLNKWRETGEKNDIINVCCDLADNSRRRSALSGLEITLDRAELFLLLIDSMGEGDMSILFILDSHMYTYISYGSREI